MFLVKKIFVSRSAKVIPLVFRDPEGSKRFETDECPICLDEFDKYNKVKMPCGHYFHSDCILDWIDKKKHNMNCPVCRINLDWTIISHSSSK